MSENNTRLNDDFLSKALDHIPETLDRSLIAKELIKNHFPRLSDNQYNSLSISLATFRTSNEGAVKAAKKDIEIQKIEIVRKLIIELNTAFWNIHQGIRDTYETNIHRRIEEITYDLIGRCNLSHIYKEFAPKSGLLDQFINEIENYIPVSSQQYSNDFIEKVHLVIHARNVWKSATGTSPPISANEGHPYFNFVCDLIEFHGKPWGVERTLKAWKTYSEGKPDGNGAHPER